MTTHFDVKARKRGAVRNIRIFEFVVREPDSHIVNVSKRDKIIKGLNEQIKIASNRSYQPEANTSGSLM